MNAIYLRKSRADLELENEMDTLIKHEKTLKEFAEKRGIEVGMIYREVVSGDTIASRPQMQKLLTDVEQGLYDSVLVMEVERLARGDTIDQGIVAQTFKLSNTKIITPIKTYDPNNEYDEEYFEFGLFMSRREFKTIKRRLNAGRLRSVKDGNYIGSISPYGYDRTVIDKRHTLKVNEAEAEIVKTIFNMFVTGSSKNEIAKYLNKLGVKTKLNKQWNITGVRDLLNNPVYIGRVKWNNRKTIKKSKNGRIVESRPRPREITSYPGIHEAIIDVDTWNKAQELNKQQLPKNPVKLQLQNPLSGLIHCAECGQVMQRRPYQKKGQEPSLICTNTECSNISSPLRFVEEKIINTLNQIYKDYKYEKKSETNKVISSKKQYETQLKKEKEKLERICSAYEDGIYSKTEFADRKKNVESKIKELEELIIQDEQSISKKEMLHRLSKFSELYSQASIEDKNLLLKSVIEKVTYKKTKRCLKKTDDPYNFELDFYLKYKE